MFRLNRFVVVMLLFLVMMVTSLSVGFAAEQGGSGLAVYTTRTELSVLPGEQKNFKIPIKNTTPGPITVKVFINNFKSDGVTGQPQIITDDKEQIANSIKGLVKEVKDFSLGANERKDVEFTVDVPANASPGGYYGVIRFAAIPQGVNDTNSQTQVSLNASVAPHLYVNVAGDVTEQIQIDSIKIYHDKESSPLFFTKPNKVAIGLSNKGNGFSKPFGRIAIKKGNTEVYSFELNNKDPRGMVLPKTSRSFDNEIKNVDKFGKYTVQASVAYGQGGEVVTRNTSFWYVPVWVAAAALLLIVVLAFVIWIVYKKLGKKQRRR